MAKSAAKNVAKKSKYIEVSVTETRIAKGRPGCGYACPIALALRGAGFRKAEVYGYKVWFDGRRDSGRTRLLPSPARRFVERFDSGKSVRPFTFKLKRPQ